jgi:hypothetical protein
MREFRPAPPGGGALLNSCRDHRDQRRKLVWAGVAADDTKHRPLLLVVVHTFPPRLSDVPPPLYDPALRSCGAGPRITPCSCGE